MSIFWTFCLNFFKYTIFQKSERRFFVCFFDKGSIDEESAVTLVMHPLVEELKLKIRKSTIFSHFQFQTRHQRSLFNFDPTLLTYGPSVKKQSSNFYSLCITKNMEQNIRIQKVLIFGPCIASILKPSPYTNNSTFLHHSRL